MVYPQEQKSGPRLWLSAAFLGGLALKILASFFLASPYLTELFTPFLNWFVIHRFQNPWEYFADLGMLRMFPYPPVMLWTLALPRLLLSPLLGNSWQAVTPLHLFAMRLPLLGFDLLIFWILLKTFPVQPRKVLYIYWLSPIVFFINYVHGQLDIVPTALLLGSIFLMLDRRYALSALALALAAASKSHVLVALPFMLVFLYRQRAGLKNISVFAGLFALVYAALVAPFALSSPGFRQMVFHSPEQDKLFSFMIPVSSSLKIVVCPTVTVLIFFKFVSYKKLNREIFLMFLGLVFACLVIFVPPMPGWFLWSLPYLIYFYLSNKEYSRAPFVIYNLVYLFYFLFFFEKPPHPLGSLDADTAKNLAMSVTLASVGFIALWMFRLGIERNEALKIKEAPLLIGIGGDSASGKHTTYHILRTLVGKEKSIPIFGDNFHKWERGNEMWNVYTHLDPSGNKLHEELETAVALGEGESVQMGRYDHKTGTFTKAARIESNKFVFFVGLHPFYLKRMRDLIPIKIFMDTDETLRRFWKIRRDTHKRGYSKNKVMAQIEQREQDSEKFIKPQARFADLVIRMEALGELDLENTSPRSVPILTRYRMDNSIPMEPLLAALGKIPTLRVHATHDVDSQEIAVTGQAAAREIMAAAFNLGLNFDELLVKTNRWLRNHHGVTQLVFLLVYNYKMKAR